jgi:hypothetical protein
VSRRWLARLGLAATVAALLVGCSLVSIAYQNADEWLLYQADIYLDLRDAQRVRLRAALRQRLADHRAAELADYVGFLDRVHRAAEDGLDVAEVDQLVARLEGLVRTTVAGTLPAIAEVLATLEPGQLDHLAAALDEDDRRYRKGSVQATAKRRADRRAKTAVRTLEHWTGDLSALQRERVTAMSGAWPDLALEWDAYRTARSAGLVELLRGRPDAAAVQRYLASRWLAHDGRSAALVSGVAAVRRGVVELIVAVDGSLTTVQRAAFLKRVRGYRTELAALLPSRSPAVADSRVLEAGGAVP